MDFPEHQNEQPEFQNTFNMKNAKRNVYYQHLFSPLVYFQDYKDTENNTE